MKKTDVRLVQWFPYGERELVEQTVQFLHTLPITELRTFISWADWTRENSSAWFSFVLDSLGKVPDLQVLPCLSYTPPSLARKSADGKQLTSHPPENLAAYSQFVVQFLKKYGDTCEWIQLWNEPNWDPYWSWELDPTGELFAEMIIPAAKQVHAAGKKTALGGTTPLDYAWFGKMEQLSVLEQFDAIGFHYSPSWQNQHRRWTDLDSEVNTLRALLRGYSRTCEVWLMETGFSTCSSSPDEAAKLQAGQMVFFQNIEKLPVERFYWYSLFDQHPDTPTDDELNLEAPRDQTAYHFGIVEADRITPKVLYSYLASKKH